MGGSIIEGDIFISDQYQVLNQDMGSFFDCVFWVDSIICFYIDRKFFVVGLLIYMGIFYVVGNVFDGGVDGIYWDYINWCIFRQVFICRNIIMAFGYCQFYFQVYEWFYLINQKIGVYDFEDVGMFFDIFGLEFFFIVDGQVYFFSGDFFFVQQLFEVDLFKVQDDFYYIFNYIVDCSKFVFDVCDMDSRNCKVFQGR